MPGPTVSPPDLSTRDERIEALLRPLAPTVEAAVRRLVERAVDTPEHEAFGAIEVAFRDAGHDLANTIRQATLASRKKRGYVGSSVPCPGCQRVAKFHSYQRRRLVTLHGEVDLHRAYYYCQRCHRGACPYDEATGLGDGISAGLRPLVCLAGTLLPFADAADDVLRRFANVRLSPSTVLRCTEAAGARLGTQLHAGRMVVPTQPEPGWAAARAPGQPYAYVGLDAFSVPMQGPGATQAEHRMLYTALVYTPDKRHARYVVDFDLDAVARQLRALTIACGVPQVQDLIAITDGGNGLEEALQRHLADDVVTILDWYHAAEHLHAFGTVWHAQDAAAARAWSAAAKTILSEQGGEALLEHLRELVLPKGTRTVVREELRKLIGYLDHNRHRTDYPRYRAQGWDIGSGPTEAGCKVIGARLKGSGMRWVEPGAATVGVLRALYVSGPKLWDGFWQQPSRIAA